MTFHLDPHLLRATTTHLRRSADELGCERDRVGRRVDALVDGTWHGDAAEGYRAACEEWYAGCSDVVRGLRALSELLDALRRDVVEHDSRSQAELDGVSTRLLERLS